MQKTTTTSINFETNREEKSDWCYRVSIKMGTNIDKVWIGEDPFAKYHTETLNHEVAVRNYLHLSTPIRSYCTMIPSTLYMQKLLVRWIASLEHCCVLDCCASI